MPAHALVTAAVLTVTPPQLVALDHPTPTSSTGGPLDPLWRHLTHSPTATTSRPSPSSGPESPSPTPTGPSTSSPRATQPTTGAAAVTGGTTPATRSALTNTALRPTGADGAATPARTAAAARTEAAASSRVAQKGASGSASSLVLTVLGMLVAAAAVAATTVRSWSRAGAAVPPAPTSPYRGRRRR